MGLGGVTGATSVWSGGPSATGDVGEPCLRDGLGGQRPGGPGAQKPGCLWPVGWPPAGGRSLATGPVVRELGWTLGLGSGMPVTP